MSNCYLPALFHDIIYEPTKSDNEEKSAQFLMECCLDKSNPDILKVKANDIRYKSAIILVQDFQRYFHHLI
jgi:predicted metal-dependent HD superfamily phosphohydrolase